MKWKFLFLIVLICETKCARILGVFPMPAYSHHSLGFTLMKELADRGHQVTMITPFPQNTPTNNLTEVIVTGFEEEMKARRTNMFQMAGSSWFITLFMLNTFSPIIAEAVLGNSNVQKLLNSDAQFDLVIQSQFLNEACFGFAYRFKAPVILLSPVGASSWVNHIVGNPAPYSYISTLFLGYSGHMTFFERVHNTIVATISEIIPHVYSFWKQNQILHKFMPDAPHLSELMYNTSLILLNSHVSTNQPVPLVANMIEIGGFHVKPPKELPEDLKNYLDEAKDGAIFFSMGSNIKCKDMEPEKLDGILKAFSKLKQKILWKWENDELPGKPDNVKLGAWLPQQDILAHPNVKLFITHGGLLSTTETVYHGVPIIALPVFGDQMMNTKIAVDNGFAIGIPYQDLTEENFSAALDQILNNPKYRKNVQSRSRIMHDRSIKPLDTAVYWVEYVIRHRGAYHLRSAALDLKWYQYFLIDVFIFLAAVSLIALTAFVWVVRKICCKKLAKVTKGKKKN